MFEVLNRERDKNLPGLLQLTAVIIGFTLMLLIEVFGRYWLRVDKILKCMIGQDIMSMKHEAWRLAGVTVTVRLPSDQNFDNKPTHEKFDL